MEKNMETLFTRGYMLVYRVIYTPGMEIQMEKSIAHEVETVIKQLRSKVAKDVETCLGLGLGLPEIFF